MNAALEAAIEELQNERSALEQESGVLLEDIQRTVGELSDLRYGKLSNAGGGDAGKEVLEGLKRLEETCDGVEDAEMTY
jgi:centromere-localized protein 2